jgi:hypothetical protein
MNVKEKWRKGITVKPEYLNVMTNKSGFDPRQGQEISL